MPRLFIFGLGYTAKRFAHKMRAEGWLVDATGSDGTVDFTDHDAVAAQIAGADVVLIKEGTRYRDSQDEITLTTDKKGEIKVSWQGAGRYFMEAEYKDDKAQKPATMRSATYTAVFEVLPD